MRNGTVFVAIIAPLLAAFAVSAVSGRFLIPFLRRVKAGQTERDDGPQSHLGKTGTPNMGGLMIMLGLAVGSLIMAGKCPEVIPVLILTVGFGLVGFIDDYLKVVKKKSDGLSVKQKMALQIVIALLFALYVTRINAIPLAMKIPFLPGKYLDLGILNIPALLFIAVATVNGTNFTDGVDGLASCVTVASALFFTIAAAFSGSGAAAAGGAMIGALLGFLLLRIRRGRSRRSYDRRTAGLFALQRISCQSIHGRHGISRARRICYSDGLPFTASAVHTDRRLYLFYRSGFRDHAGGLL